MNRSWIAGTTLVPLLLLSACERPEPTAVLLAAAAEPAMNAGDAALENRTTLPTSLHATAAGMRYWYEHPDGFGSLTGAPYDPLSCATCHVAAEEPASCAGCHDGAASGRGTVRQETCLVSCHARQAAEMQLPDVHRAAGLRCWDCHTSAEMHGDGSPDASMLEPGVMEASCTRCHGPPSNATHLHHADRLACVSCHMATSVTCVNCHFETEVKEHRRIAAGKVTGWQLLGRYRNQVYPLNFQSLEYQGTTFVAWGPYHGHTIVAEGRACADCHANANVADLLDADGQLRILDWDDAAGRFIPAQGVIPVPPDYATALLFDFVALAADGVTRTFLETGPDASHMLFAAPLTTEQMAALATPQEPHHAEYEGPPLCGGLPATIWVGMDPSLLPRGASITASAAHDDTSHDGCTGGEADGSGPVRYVITGTRGPDVIVGSSTPDSILGLGGDDVLCGRQARDVILGGRGDDHIDAGPGADLVLGEEGDDRLDGGPGWDTLHGGPGDDWLFGKEGQDRLFGEDGDDFLFGGKSPDLLDGGPGTNHLEYGPEICEGTPGEGGGSGGGGHDDGTHDDGGCTDGTHDDGGCTGSH